MTERLSTGTSSRNIVRRPASPEDAALVADLWNARSEATRGVRLSSPESVRKAWDHPTFDLSTDSRLVFAAGGGASDPLIGYAHVRDVKDPPVDVFGGYSVHPDFDDAAWLWDELFDWMDAEARRVIPRAPRDARIALVAGASEQATTAQVELERHGFEHSRTFHRMQIEFDASMRSARWPADVSVRTIELGADDEALVAAHREAFAGHYGHLEQPFDVDLADWRRWMAEDDFDPSLWFLAHAVADDAVADGTIVGFCTCYAEAPGAPSFGLIDELGVRPAWRRRGIARGLLLHALETLRRRGISGAVLTVDTENRSGAPTLYEQVGMAPIQSNHTYVKELRPGVNLVVQ